MEEIQRTATALTLLLREMVDKPEELSVIPVELAGGGCVFHVTASQKDCGHLIGTGGRTARSLRIVLTAIGTKIGHKISLDLGRGVTGSP